ncbi:unnamed protein product [Darwinula stevensoni]|uniref:Tetraspanin n=1 Tax=Darwinula stevensoni TaxID=69355 RepID=A0A7R9A919_9CRUS|nr:unnamed protein product [Darwinula stevensoni]CAG0897012.1 unnamed protein product [Darwinula stevensoni]
MHTGLGEPKIVVCGVMAFTGGIWRLAIRATVISPLVSDLFPASSACIQIAAGAVAVLLAYFRCRGEIKKVKCMLVTYSIFLLLLSIVLFVIGPLGFAFREEVEESIDKAMRKTLFEYDDRKENSVRLAWDHAQEKVCGLVVLAGGIWKAASHVVSPLVSDLFPASAYIQIAAGAVVVLLAFLGFCGEIKKVKCMLVTYSVLLSLLFIVLFLVGILGFAFRDEVVDSIDVAMRKALIEYDDRKQDSVRLGWDHAQKKLRCCGIEMAEEWQGNHHLNGRYPKSCCRFAPEGDMLLCEYNVAYTWSEGCRTKLETYIRNHGAILTGIGIWSVLLTVR